MTRSPAYWDYLRLNTLLDLQGGLEGTEEGQSADELLFIVTHQTYELWFKVILRGIRDARDQLSEPHVAEATIPHVVESLRRVNTVLDVAVKQFDILETMTPQGFLEFRTKLTPASGFQSYQMREMEIVLGLKDKQRVRLGDKIDPMEHIKSYKGTSDAADQASEALDGVREESTLLAALNTWLYRTPIHGSVPSDEGDEEAVKAFVDGYLAQLHEHHQENLKALVASLGEDERERWSARFEIVENAARDFLDATDIDESVRDRARRVRAAILFIESYRKLPLLSWPRLLIDLIVELEERMVLFRHRHARMVERVIGRRVGTGGSSGVEYLDKTTGYRVFRDLWAVRTLMLPPSQVPSLQHPEVYGFVGR